MPQVIEVFFRFLALGFVSFGGPAAHIGYFQTAFVQKLKWIDQDSYAKLVALSQFLPGPGSSQVGFAIGLRRAGLFGGLAAFLGFTFPSFVLLYLLATIGADSSGNTIIAGVIYGLKLLAVVVVADACLSMFKTFCKNRLSISLAVLSAVCLLTLQSLWMQMGVLCAAALIGGLRKTQKQLNQQSREGISIKWQPLAFFGLFFFVLPLIAVNSQWLSVFSNFYYSGSLVFGGGHVVLPLLQQSVGDALTTDQFLTGYAAAQAVPGPMFSLSAYLGAGLTPDNQLLGALLATAGIFLPGFLLVLALQDAWESLSNIPKVAGAAAGINAAVVGILMAALYQPIFVSAVLQPLDMALVLMGFFALRVMLIPIVYLVLIMAGAGIVLSL